MKRLPGTLAAIAQVGVAFCAFGPMRLVATLNERWPPALLPSPVLRVTAWMESGRTENRHADLP